MQQEDSTLDADSSTARAAVNATEPLKPRRARRRSSNTKLRNEVAVQRNSRKRNHAASALSLSSGHRPRHALVAAARPAPVITAAMLADTWPNYLLLRAVILFLQWLGPACLAVTVYTFYTAYPGRSTCSWTTIWLAAESIWYLFMRHYYRHHLQRPAQHPPLRSREERRALFAKVRSEIHDPEKFLSGWFRGARPEEIGREELRRFLDWAFWDGRAKLGKEGEDYEEMEEYFGKIEKMMRRPFAEGKGKAKALRLTLDPVEMECRTLVWYALMMLADTVTHISMLWAGFAYFKTLPTSLLIFPPRPLATCSIQKSPSPNISFWLKPHTSRTRLPVLYIHGIGIGLINQTTFLRALDSKLNGDATLRSQDGNVGILVLEIPQISSRLAQPLLPRENFLDELTLLLDSANFSRFVLASHSYGSVPHTHILNHAPLADRIAGSLLIDPVTLLLHMPDVAYNFTARQPRHTNEWELWYFASRDPGVASTLGRHFFWFENLLWRDHLLSLVQRDGMKVTASLASDDLIVDTEAVRTYLSENVVPDPELTFDGEEKRERMELKTHGAGDAEAWKRRSWKGRGLEVMWWEGLDHAQVFDTRGSRGRLVDVLVEYSWDK